MQRDGVQLRCRAGTIWYVVRELEEGQVLRVTGEREGWLGVEYPPGTPVVARIERVELRENRSGDRFAVLTRPSALYAFNNQAKTSDDSYVQVFASKPIEAGTRLAVVDTVDRRGGTIGGYLVSPPRGAVGFIQPLASDVRTATQAEIDAFLEESGWGATEDNDEANAAQLEEVPASDDTSGAGQSAPSTDNDDQDDASDTANQAPDTVADQGDADADRDDPYVRIERRLDALDEALRRVLESPVMDAELTGLIDSYEGLRFALPEGPESAAFRDAIGVRIEVLDLREELQRLAREAADLDARVRTTPDTEAVARSSSLGYEAVGRLMPSLIYDGQRLPLLYRIVSIDTAYGRTVAYVAPREGLGITAALGAIVGVQGEPTTEQDRRVPVLTPERIDVLRSGE